MENIFKYIFWIVIDSKRGPLIDIVIGMIC